MKRSVGAEQIFKYRSLRKDLVSTKIFSDEGFISSAGKEIQNTLLQQKISEAFLNRMYFDAFYLARNPLASKFIPVPKNWINKIEINLNKNLSIFSKYSWKFFLIRMSLNAIKKSFFVKKFIWDLNPENDFQIVLDPRDLEIPSNANLIAEYSFINWLSKERFPDRRFSITDGNRVVNSNCGQINFVEVSKTSFISKLANIMVNISKMFCALAEIISCTSWKSILILDQIVFKKKIESMSDCTEPLIALFSNSFGSYRPLWTTAEIENEIEAVSYFYSLELEPILIESNIPPDTLLTVATWDEYWVINKAQSKKLNTVLSSKARVQVVGFPWMSDSPTKYLNENDGLKIALFDIAFKDDFVGWSTYYHLGLAGEEFHAEFVWTVMTLSKQYNFQVLHKMKIQSDGNSKYNKFIDGIQGEFPEHLVKIDSRTSPIRLAKIVDGSISQPYTSTAEWCRSYTNSVYFNPKKDKLMGVLKPTEIPELNKEELELWIIELTKVINQRNN